jgi:hypothetical protein
VLVQQRLTECDGFAMVDVRGGPGAGVWSPPETPSSYGVVFVRSGCFRRLSEGVEAVLDPTSVYFEAPGREQQLLHAQADGDRRTTIEMVPLLAANGADIIELGVPFSDPVADGPTIQYSSEQALKKGACLPSILEMVREIRKRTDVPVLLMSYINPLHSYGFKNIFVDAKEAGVDGFIIPDLIPEESSEIKGQCEKNGLSLVLLAAPNTPPVIAKKLRDEVAKAVASPDLVEQFKTQGMAPVASESAEFCDLIKAELARWAQVIKDSGVKPQ